MTLTRLLSVLILTGLLALAAACGSARRGVPLTGDHEVDDPELVLGQRTFDSFCHSCHPGGTAGLGPALNNKPLPGWLIRTQVRAGLGPMPAFSDKVIPDEELDALVTYLKYLRSLEVDVE